MPPERRGGPKPPDRKPRPPSGPGKLSQRTDLSQPGPQRGQGVYVPRGLPFGQREQMEQGQGLVPLPARRTQPAAQPITIPPRQPTAEGEPSFPSILEILARPSIRPDEPVTAGLPMGPGPGPEALLEPDVGDRQGLGDLAAVARSPGMPFEIRAIGMLLEVAGRISQRQVPQGLDVEDLLAEFVQPQREVPQSVSQRFNEAFREPEIG